MRITGFIQDQPISKIEYLSDTWILYYQIGDKEDEIRAASFVLYGKFFDLSSGEEIKIANLLNFEIVDERNIVIFNSKDRVSDFDLAVQYKMFQTLLNDNLNDDVSLKN